MAVINQNGNVDLSSIVTQKMRQTSSGGYTYYQIADRPNRSVTDTTGWQSFRVNDTTNAVDFERGADGNESDQYIYAGPSAGTAVASRNYGEV